MLTKIRVMFNNDHNVRNPGKGDEMNARGERRKGRNEKTAAVESNNGGRKRERWKRVRGDGEEMSQMDRNWFNHGRWSEVVRSGGIYMTGSTTNEKFNITGSSPAGLTSLMA